VKNYLPLAIVLVLATAYGLWWKRGEGAIRSNKAIPGHRLSEQVLGEALGSRATMVQFILCAMSGNACLVVADG
jgi:hypothetical protein